MNAQSGEKKPLRDLLETQNKTKIARKMGLDPSTVARWARGESIPTGDNLLELAKLLGVSADSILVGSAAA
jgi:transcriptional regulator with XRE-family HTH domain